MGEWLKNKKKEVAALKKGLDKEMKDRLKKKMMKDFLQGSDSTIKSLSKADAKDLFNVQTNNAIRRAEIVNFLKKQVQGFQEMGQHLIAKQKHIMKIRKKLWMQNDKLNKYENQRVIINNFDFFSNFSRFTKLNFLHISSNSKL